jgi:hypothetical protein
MSSSENKTLLSIWRTFFANSPINLAYKNAYQFGVFEDCWPINLAYKNAYQFGVLG